MPLTPLSLLLPNPPVSAASAGQGGGQSFAAFLQEKLAELNDLQLQADQLAQQFVTDKSPDVHRVTLALEEASLSLQLAVQVHNKVVEAYQEIARMQL